MTTSTKQVPHATGLIIIEVRNSNPNGDPDRESDPRRRQSDGRAYITDVSFKRKLRSLVEEKGEVWNQLKGEREAEKHGIFESRKHSRAEIEKEVKDINSFTKHYWDSRVFGNTVLQEQGGDTIRTGVVQFGIGMSVAPVEIERFTLTKIAPASGSETATRGMAPLGLRVVRHAVYYLPFIINPTAAERTGCSREDTELLLDLIPYAYSHTLAHNRAMIEIRYAWYMEHQSPLGSFSDFQLLDAMKPTRKGDPNQPSISWNDYEVPSDFPDEIKAKLNGRVTLEDLMERAWNRS